MYRSFEWTLSPSKPTKFNLWLGGSQAITRHCWPSSYHPVSQHTWWNRYINKLVRNTPSLFKSKIQLLNKSLNAWIWHLDKVFVCEISRLPKSQFSRNTISVNMRRQPPWWFLSSRTKWLKSSWLYNCIVLRTIGWVLDTLTDREENVLRLRFGLDDGKMRTLKMLVKSSTWLVSVTVRLKQSFEKTSPAVEANHFFWFHWRLSWGRGRWLCIQKSKLKISKHVFWQILRRSDLTYRIGDWILSI